MSYTFNYSIDKKKRTELNEHSSFVIWLTGLSGAGKSSIANELEICFNKQKLHSYVLDGDNLRIGINKDLDFTNEGRTENIRRTAEIAKILLDNGIIVIGCLISPMSTQRQLAKEIIGTENFIEIHIDCPLEICASRDTKGLYKKAKKKALSNFTGVSMEYEAPLNPALKINTASESIEKSAKTVINYLKLKKHIV